jgi:uncharacterized membrane protein YphA (DoxX/SURF4 family)
MFKKIINSKAFITFSRAVLALVFIYAAIGKITDPETFAQSIINYKLFPVVAVNVIAIVIPWIELTAGILLLFGIAAKENIIIINTLLFLFIIMVAISMARGLNIDCGCYGARGGEQVGFQKIFENAVLFSLGLIIYLNKQNPLSIDKSN